MNCQDIPLGAAAHADFVDTRRTPEPLPSKNARFGRHDVMSTDEDHDRLPMMTREDYERIGQILREIGGPNVTWGSQGPP